MDSNERYVREKWEIDDFDLECSHGGSWRFKESCPLHILDWFGWTAASPDALGKLWSAAADFTRAHEKKISDVEEEIALLEAVVGTTTAFIASIYVAKHIKQDAAKESPVWQRILAARQAALDELRKGWKGGK